MGKSEDLLKQLQEEINSQEYNDDSIDTLEGEDRVRTRPEALLGSNGIEGAKHTIKEIVGNATDEKLAGFGDRLNVELYEDGSISVRDYGRGVPLGWNEKKGQWNYFLIYEELYAGGKYGDAKKQSILKRIDELDAWDSFNLLDYRGMVSIGLNGLGAAATQCSSSSCEVISYRDGKANRMLYADGKHILDELQISDTAEENGTFVKWKPDDKVFKDTKIPHKWLEKFCKQTSYVTGFTVTFKYKGVTKVFEEKTLVAEMLSDVDYATAITNKHHAIDEEGDYCVCEAEIIIGSGGRGTEFFHNRVEVNGGVHSSAYNSALSYFFSSTVSYDKGIKIRDTDYSGKFSILASSLSSKMSVRGQTKDSLDDTFVYVCLYDAILELLKLEYAKGTGWFLDIIDEVVINAQHRIEIAEMSKNLKDVERAVKRHKTSEKFVSCESYERGSVEETEYFIVEGDSAGGRVKTARNSSYQCYLAIRGKSLNVYKAPIAKLIANREIRDMISSLGCGIDLGIDEYESFNINKLKVGKIIFLADADIDGQHILMLLFLIFYKLFPELLYQGKVYVCETPLHVINCKDNTVVYCMSDKELEEKKSEIGEHNIRTTDRFKGLGETAAEALWETTLNPETRVLRQLKIERGDMELTDLLEVFFGKSTDRRKRAILGSMMENFDSVIEELDNVSDYIESLELSEDLDVELVQY